MTVRRADTWRARLLGLALRRTTDHALYFPRCRSVHTIGMRFALDLVWVREDGSVVRIDHAVGPFRVRSCRDADGVVETPAGAADGLIAATLGRSWLP